MEHSKRWLIFVGSPRKGQNTDRLAAHYQSALEHYGRTCEKVMLGNLQLNPCQGCSYCLSNRECHFDDKLNGYLAQWDDLEGIVIASPSYFYNVTGQTKILLDRTFAFYERRQGRLKSRLEGKGLKAVLLATCAGSSIESMGFTMEAMRLTMRDLGIEVLLEKAYYGTKETPVKDSLNLKEQSLNEVGEVLCQQKSCS